MNSEKDETSDLLVNNLIYVSPEPLSLAVARSSSRQFCQRSVYSAGETIRCDFNSGSQYCDPGNSYLTFNIQLTGDSTFRAGWGCGSACNIFNQSVLRSKSGTELDRVERLNIWTRIKTLNTESRAYLESTGSVEGWDVGVALGTSTSNEWLYPLRTTVPVTYAIPLKRLSGFFEPIKNGQLIPACIFSGLTLELILEDFRTALVKDPSSSGNCTGYTISNISFMCDNVTLTDDTQKTLNSHSASVGLELTYPRVYTSINDTPSSQNTLSAQVRKAVSNCMYSVAVVLNPAYMRDITIDSFVSRPYEYTNWQARVGSLYFPAAPVSDPNSNGVEAFFASKMVFNKLKNEHQEGAVTYTSF